jgi:UDP-glucose 4-epimerase
MTKAVVTGGRGFIGSHLVDNLIDRDWKVSVVDNLSADRESFLLNPKADYFQTDINYGGLKQLTAFEGVDYIFHLAAETRIPSCIENPTLAMKTNVLGTCNILETARLVGAKRVIFSSTAAIYGTANQPPVHEDMPPDCLNPYSVSKLAGEQLCKMYSDLYGLDTAVLRYFNVYGERQPTKGQYAPVIGIFQRQMHAGEPMTVVGDGTQSRDYIHVSDVVNANVMLAVLDEDMNGNIFNVGTGESLSVLDLVRLIGGQNADYKHIPPRGGEVHLSLARIDKLKATGWSPQVDLKQWLKHF